MSKASNPLGKLRREIAAALAQVTPAGRAMLARDDGMLPIEPPRPAGFSSTICFDIASERLKPKFDRLAEAMGKKAAKKALKEESGRLAETIADELAGTLSTLTEKIPQVVRVEAESGYLNFYFDVRRLGLEIVKDIVKAGKDFGGAEARAERVMVEYSQPNTHKPFHVGHARNVALGISVSNILESAGYPVIRANYIGDIGAHVIKCLWAMLRFPDEFTGTAEAGKRLGAYYALADRAESEEEVTAGGKIIAVPKVQFDAEVKELFARWERKDPQIVDLWTRTRRESLDSFDRIYEILGARFDHVFYESRFEQEGKSCVEDMVAKGIAEIGGDGEYKGAVFVDLDRQLPGSDLRKMVVLRADGTSLYQTKELALARRKFEDFGIDRSIYIVASEQSFYFKQVFAILKLWGFPQADACVHLPYEIVTLPEGKMSSRSGTVVLFDDLLEETLAGLERITAEKGYAEDSRAAALRIAVGAIKFSMLNVDHNKVVVFDWEQALNFTGQASPYIQYMAVRAKRILAEAGDSARCSEVPEVEPGKEEAALAMALGRFPDVAAEAAQLLAPYVITRYAFTLSRLFGEFYRFCPVLKSESPLREWRLSLVSSLLTVLERCLALLGIEIPDAM